VVTVRFRKNYAKKGDRLMSEETRIGKIDFEEGKFILEVEGKREELRAGIVADESQLRKLVGKEVEVLYSKPQPAIVGLVAKGFKPILCYILVRLPHPLCYIPADPWMFRGVEDKIRFNIAERFRKEGLISKDVYGKITQG
jgi:hypothetical protein